MSAARGSVVPEAVARARAEAARSAGRRVVLTNGAFDVLHVGHVRMLADAATLGDLLIVAINDDESVRASRGAGRPIVPAAERAELVAAVAGVALVFVFGDRTVDRLLETLLPHVHAKGREYSEATHPEAATDRRLGIAMAFVGDAKTHAASDRVDRMRIPPVESDRMIALDVSRGRGVVLHRRRDFLARERLLDPAVLLAPDRGREITRHATHVVRRVELSGEVAFTKVEHPAKRGGHAFSEFETHVAMRVAGFRVPEPWLALEGRAPDGRPVAALVTKELRGTPLDGFLRANFAAASGRERVAWARGIGSALRRLHTTRFVKPDLSADSLVVDGTPAGGVASIGFVGLSDVQRVSARMTPAVAAPGLAALSLSLRPVCPRRFRLAVLRAYLGGSFSEARPWLRAIDRCVKRVERRRATRKPAGMS